jgi:hypothetical protein
MTDEQKPKPEKRHDLDDLELNRETLEDLTEGEAEQGRGATGIHGGQVAQHHGALPAQPVFAC